MIAMFRSNRARAVIQHERRPCECGCGRSFIADVANRARKYARDCPNLQLRLRTERDKNNEKQRKKAALRRAMSADNRGRRIFVGSDGAERRSVKVCFACGNLPERRPPEGCASCDMPAGPPAPIRPFHSSKGYDGWTF